MQKKNHKLDKASKNSKKQLGQYMTPDSVARFMAKLLFDGLHKKKIKILEPSAGMGSLVLAAYESITNNPKKPEQIEFVLYEIDSLLIPYLKSLANDLRGKAKKIGIKVKFSIRNTDFLLNIPDEKFDAVIANPPFFKLKKLDPRSVEHKYVVHGQPNIYGLFMASCAQLLKDSGRYCFLTPRSWTSGSYFAELRKYIFKYLQLDAVHLFQYREFTFKQDRIQQEMMITVAKAQSYVQEHIMLSASDGVSDLGAYAGKLVPLSNVFNNKNCQVVHLPFESAPLICKYKDTLESIGLNASTGKVVPFRASTSILNSPITGSVPLLWMKHVTKNKVDWPLNVDKEYFNKDGNLGSKLLIPKDNYVLIRRFSPRDQKNWITAAPLLGKNISSEVGIENHLNYVYGLSQKMHEDEAKGLAAYLNSSHVNQYFKTRIGHTQINASDLKVLPVPSRFELAEIGKSLNSNPSQKEMDDLVDSVLQFEERVII